MVIRNPLGPIGFRGIRSLGFAALSLCAVSGCEDSVDSSIYGEDSNAERLELAQIDIAPSRIRFSAGPEDVELALTPNTQLFGPGATVVRDGEALSLADAQIDAPYQGVVVGDPNSWVRVRVIGDRFEGLIFKESQLWEVRADGRGA